MNRFLTGLAVCILLAAISIDALDKKHCKCKIKASPKMIPLMIGGRIAPANSYPWHVSMSEATEYPKDKRKYYSEDFKISVHSCGGTIINEKYILMAAHCVIRGDFFSFGPGNDLVKIFDNGRIHAKRTIIHPDYNEKGAIVNDIAIVELDKEIEFNENVQPACLGQTPTKNYGNKLLAIGFGSTSKVYVNPNNRWDRVDGESSRYLKEVDYKDVSDLPTSTMCREKKGIICADAVKKGDSACLGDSSSPIHFTKNGKTEVIGLTSGSDYIEKKDRYKVLCNGYVYFTSVQYHLDFIKKYVKNEHC